MNISKPLQNTCEHSSVIRRSCNFGVNSKQITHVCNCSLWAAFANREARSSRARLRERKNCFRDGIAIDAM